MSLIDQALADWQQFSSDADNGFATPITFTTPDGNTTVTVNGLGIKHHLGINTEGLPANVKNASVTVSEALLTGAGYVVRNSNKEVAIKDHLVIFKDSSGNNAKYIIRETYPDETVGIITCILGDWE